MPQLDLSFYFSQFVWFLISFGGFFAVISKLIYPKVELLLSYREEAIKENTKMARKMLSEIASLRQEEEEFKANVAREVEKIASQAKELIKSIALEEEGRAQSAATMFIIHERARMEERLAEYSKFAMDSVTLVADKAHVKVLGRADFLPSSIDNIGSVLDLN